MPESEKKLARALSVAAVGVSIGAIIWGAILFFLLPRVSAGYMGKTSFNPTLLSGFSDQVEVRHPVGARRIVSGKVGDDKFGRQMVHPDYMVDPAKRDEIPELETIYPATEGLPPRRVRRKES